MKSISFRGDSLDALRAFPVGARREGGYQLDKVQLGLEPDDWKPMTSIGRGVREIRIWDESGTFRIIYIAKLAEAIYVLHCFQKKSQETSAPDIAIARKRYQDLLKERK